MKCWNSLEIEVLNTDKNALDITETDEVLHFGEINRPDVIINVLRSQM